MNLRRFIPDYIWNNELHGNMMIYSRNQQKNIQDFLNIHKIKRMDEMCGNMYVHMVYNICITKKQCCD